MAWVQLTLKRALRTHDLQRYLLNVKSSSSSSKKKTKRDDPSFLADLAMILKGPYAGLVSEFNLQIPESEYN